MECRGEREFGANELGEVLQTFCFIGQSLFFCSNSNGEEGLVQMAEWIIVCFFYDSIDFFKSFFWSAGYFVFLSISLSVFNIIFFL